MKKSTYLIALALGASTITFAQNVGINTDGTDPDSDALLHVKDNNADSSVVRVENEQSKLTKFELRNPSAKWDLRIPTGETDLRINNGSGQDHVTIQNDGDVGIGTTTPASGLDVQTSMGLAHAVVNTTPVTLDQDDNVVLVDDAGGDRTITLPLASGNSGRVYYIKKTSSSENEITIQRNTSATIDGATSVVLYVQYDAIRILCDGTNWHIIADERIPHSCQIKKTTAAQTVNSTTVTKATLTDEVFDIGGISDLGNNEIDIKRDGRYLVQGFFKVNATNDQDQLAIYIYVNGAERAWNINYVSYAKAGHHHGARISEILELSTGDDVDIRVYQNSGSSWTTDNSASRAPTLTVTEIR